MSKDPIAEMINNSLTAVGHSQYTKLNRPDVTLIDDLKRTTTVQITVAVYAEFDTNGTMVCGTGNWKRLEPKAVTAAMTEQIEHHIAQELPEHISVKDDKGDFVHSRVKISIIFADDDNAPVQYFLYAEACHNICKPMNWKLWSENMLAKDFIAVEMGGNVILVHSGFATTLLLDDHVSSDHVTFSECIGELAKNLPHSFMKMRGDKPISIHSLVLIGG